MSEKWVKTVLGGIITVVVAEGGRRLWERYKDAKSSENKQLSRKERKTVILGMQGAGKTTMWYYLRNGQFPSVGESKTTNVDEIKEFSLDNGQVQVIIVPTKDIGGQDSYVGHYYNSLITNDSFVYFFFNIEDLGDEEKVKLIKARLRRIENVVKEKEISQERIRIKLVGTHLDKCPHMAEYVLREQIVKETGFMPENILLGALTPDGNLAEEIKQNIVKGAE